MKTIFGGISKSRNIYTLGGTVQAGGGRYLSRDADEELLNLCREGTFAYVLTTRQVGKSSLMVRTAQQLASEGIRSVIIDLTQLGQQQTADQWHLGLLTEIARQLALETDVFQWWQARQDQGVTARLTLFLREVVLGKVSQPVVIFIDEIDTTLKMDFTDDFYAAIRFIHNGRAHTPEFQRLCFVLIGVATPNDLIRDLQRTPFNIGTQVNLTDFTFEEALPLADGLGLPPDESRQTLRWVLKWTGGHPFLTQRLCRAIAEQGRGSWTENDVARLVAGAFFGEKSAQDSNLQAVRDLLTRRAPDISAVLTTYSKVRRGRRVLDEEKSLVKSHLKLSGVVVKGKDNALCLRNPIYREVFDKAWVKDHLPVNWQKRLQRAAIGLIATLFLISTPVAIWASRESIKAGKQKIEAERQKDVAIAALEEAKKQKSLAQEQEQKALEQTRMAEWHRQNAERAREDAENSRQELDRQLVQTLEEQGRLELLRGNAQSAAVYLSAAYLRKQSQEKNGEDSSLQLLLARAILPLQGLASSHNGHESWVLSVAFSSDGKRIVTAGGDRIAKIWDAATNKPPVTLKGHTGLIRTAVFSPNDQLVVTASSDGTAKIWDAVTGKEHAPLKGHTDIVYTAAFSPDGAHVVTASKDKTVRVWETRTGAELHCFKDHTDEVNTAVFSRDGQFILSAGDDRKANIWNFARKELIASLDGQKDGKKNGHTELIFSAAFSPDGKLVVTASADKTAKVWEAGSGRLRFTLDGKWRHDDHDHDDGHKGHVHNAVFSPDGKRIVTMSDDGTAKIWNPESGKLIVSLAGHQDRISSVAFSPKDGKYIITTSRDKTARVWEAATGELLASLDGHTDKVDAATFSPNGKWVVTASGDKTAKVWDWEARRKATNISLDGHNESIGDVAFSSDSQRIVTWSQDRKVRAWDASGRLIACLGECKPRFFSAAFSPDSKFIITGDEDGAASIWEAETGKLSHRLTGHARAGKKEHVHHATFSPDGRLIVTASDDGTAKVWDAKNYTPLATIYDPGYQVQYAELSRDNRRVVTQSVSDTEVIAKLWDAKSGRLIEPLDNPTPRPKLVDGEGTQPEPLTDGRAPTESRRATARNSSTGDVTKRVLFTSFSPDGKLVVTASDDGTTKIWESETGKRRWAIDKHSGWVYSATFSPDSKSVITANEDGTARLYDVASGKQLTAFIGHSPHVNYASFSPDGQRIATASDDGTAKIWDVASGRLLISFNGQQEEVRKAVFSRDNTRLITVGDGTSAKIWRVDLEKRSPREIDNLVKRFVPFRLKGVEVVPVMDEAEASKPASLASRKN